MIPAYRFCTGLTNSHTITSEIHSLLLSLNQFYYPAMCAHSYGVGYHMTVVKDTNCVSMEVERLVKSFVPTAKQATDVGAELSFILPSTEVAHFPELFDKIDGKV